MAAAAQLADGGQRGLLGRFVYALPKSHLGYRNLEPRPIPGDVLRRYRSGIRQLIGFVPDEIVQLRLSQSAYQEWKEFQRAVELQFREGGLLETLKDWGSKLPGAALRLAGVFHVSDRIGSVLSPRRFPRKLSRMPWS